MNDYVSLIEFQIAIFFRTEQRFKNTIHFRVYQMFHFSLTQALTTPPANRPRFQVTKPATTTALALSVILPTNTAD